LLINCSGSYRCEAGSRDSTQRDGQDQQKAACRCGFLERGVSCCPSEEILSFLFLIKIQEIIGVGEMVIII